MGISATADDLLISPFATEQFKEACARLIKTDCSARPILSLPSKERIKYFASMPWQETNKNLTLSILRKVDYDQLRS